MPDVSILDSAYVIGPRDANGKPSVRYKKQEEFYRNQKNHRYNVFGGATGSGKTLAICDCVAEDLHRYLIGDLPPLKIACLHVDSQKALGITVEKLVGQNGCCPAKTRLASGQYVNWLADSHGRDRMNKTERIMWFGPPDREPCMIYWSGLASETKSDIAFMLCGYDFDDILWSQMESVEETAFLAVRKRLGRRKIENFVPRMLGDANPKSCWVKDIFHDGQIYEGDDPNEYYFLNSCAEDNEGADPKYLASQRSSPDAKRFYLGLWDTTEGLVYNQYNRKMSEVEFDKIPFKDWWRIDTNLDYGRHTHPFAALFTAEDNDGNLFWLSNDEFYKHSIRQAVDRVNIQRERLLRDICYRMGLKEPTPQMRGRYFGGPDFNRPTDDKLGLTLGEMAYRDPTDPKWEGIPVEVVTIAGSSDAKESAFVNALYELTIPIMRHKHPITGETPAPRLYISERCTRAKDQLISATYDPDRIDHVKKNEVRNKFPSLDIDGNTIDDPTRVHHWDLHDCGLIAGQRVWLKDSPKAPTVIPRGSYVIKKPTTKGKSNGWA